MDDPSSERAPTSETATTTLPQIPALGRPLFEEHAFEHDTEKLDNPSQSIGKGDTAGQEVPDGVESPRSEDSIQGTTFPSTAYSSEYGSRIGKPDTEIVTPTLQDRQESAPRQAYPHPVKSFSLPPWAIGSHGDTSSSQIRRDDLEGTGRNAGHAENISRGSHLDLNTEKRGIGSVDSPSALLVESPFTDDAAIQQSPIGPRRILPSGIAISQEPQSSSPIAEYFPSMLKVQTNVDGAAGPFSAASDPYTMHRTLGNDPIYQHTVPNTPRELHPRSLSAHLAQHPDDTARRAVRKTYPKPNPLFRFVRRFKIRHDVIKGCSEQEMMRFEKKEGKKRRRLAGWRLAEEDSEEDKFAEDGVERPVVSELFWKVYMSIMPTLERDPLSGLVAPPLIGSTGTMPLTIISLIPDIMRHYRDVIVRAEKEVFLVTNYWQPSNSVETIVKAMRELSDAVLKRTKDGEKPQKVVMKLIYDRGSVEQLWNSHVSVKPKDLVSLKIPVPEEIPGIDLQVINFHRVLLGTFHAKFLIVDRKVALINSNNIQDRPNLEMMTHLEGPIVDSFYETALHSWYNKLEPILPCIAQAYQPPSGGYRFGGNNPYFAEIEVVQAAKAARKLLRRETAAREQGDDAQFEEGFMMTVRRAMERAAAVGGERWDEFVAHHTGEDNPLQVLRGRVRAGFSSRPTSRRPSMDLIPKLPQRRASAPMGLSQHLAELSVNSDSSATDRQESTLVDSGELPPTAKSPPKQAFDLPSKQVKIEEPPQPIRPGQKTTDTSTTVDSASKPLSTDVGGRPRSGSQRMQALSEKFNAGALSEAWATVEDSDDLDTFQPHIIHAPHKPFPIAMTSRKPHGMPGHHDIRNPQNAAWLAACRYAKRKIWIQTPTLNARPIKRAVKQACRRGVEVILFLDLGFNDKGESIPFQGGTNEQVVVNLYKILSKENKEQHLKVYWYTGKDQIRPLNAVHKQRNCHIKFAMFDDEVAILGNGNMDTQSWMHSQETNIMINSKEVIAEMMATLYSNQNTHLYGLVGTDGIWRDAEGKDMNHYDSLKKGRHQGLAGIIQFIKTI
ncbi:hypothetical protein NliqN6_5599 [Naganishia liquefaciens]|uniref:PLD phosphodiesterase domain-containing protein n=1 Tax=Naganishia liquefaciens TaxID=104408 RepID=A0A8H3TY02_9TREE|nr:hypothetical protein NliqN6_5599 [Naganishia liquefaciens]